MTITKDNSIQSIIDLYPESKDLLKNHGIDVDDNCLYSVRHLPIKECPTLCGLENMEDFLEKINQSVGSSISSSTVGELVAQQSLRAQVFEELGIDFCCGGKISLEEACKKKQIDMNGVIEKLLASDRQVGGANDNFNESSLTDLANHIENTHHVYLKKELPRLSALAEKVARVHGEKEPRMIEVKDLFNKVRSEIEPHTMKEEMVLFPYIRDLESKERPEAPPFGTVANPINCMEADHIKLGEALEKFRELTDDYIAPEGACGSWRALLGGLEHFDKDTRIHIHKENSILYPKAIEKEGQYSSN